MTVMQLNKSMPGLADAPLEWHYTHRDGIVASGCVESKVAKAFYLCFGPDGELEGLVGTHVDDDISTGSPWYEANIQTRLDETFSYGPEQRDKLELSGTRIQAWWNVTRAHTVPSSLRSRSQRSELNNSTHS